MPNNSFIGQVCFLDGANYPSWLTYDSSNDYFMGAINNGIFVGQIEIFTHQSDFDFSDTSSGEHIDRFGNTIVDTKATTGKLTITLDASIYTPMVKLYSGNPVNIVVLSTDIGQGVYIHQVVPTFNKKTVAGKMQIAEMTFKFIQGANVLPAAQRHRLFEIIASTEPSLRQ